MKFTAPFKSVVKGAMFNLSSILIWFDTLYEKCSAWQ